MVEDRLDDIFRSLSDGTRRDMLARLRAGPLTVGELAEPFDMSLAGASKHVRMLERAGLIERRVEGRRHICRLAADPLREADRWLTHYRAFWTDKLDRLEQALKEDDHE